MLCDVSRLPLQLILNPSNAPPRIDVGLFLVLFAAHRGDLLREGDEGRVEACEMFGR